MAEGADQVALLVQGGSRADGIAGVGTERSGVRAGVGEDRQRLGEGGAGQQQ
jgi:hypothetical protein